MSKINDLIKKLCPNGVKYKILNDVCEKIYAGGTPKTNNESYYNGDIKWLRSGEINFNEIYDTEIRITDEGLNNSSAKLIPKHSVVIAMTGATVARTAIIMDDMSMNQSVCALIPIKDLNYRFLYQCLSNQYKELKSSGQGVLTSLNIDRIKKIIIPVPPIEVQEEIVRILDKFGKLEAELEAELEARKSQYEFWRDQIFKFKNRTDVKWVKLGNIKTDIYRGNGIKRDEITETGIPCVRYGEIYTTYNIWFDKCKSHTSERVVNNPKTFSNNDLLFAITGESVEDISKTIAYLGNETCYAGGDIVVMKHNQNGKYLSYALSTSDAIRQKGKGKVKSKVVHSSVPSIEEIVVPIVSLDEQNEIVKKLDDFYVLLNDINYGLPAEIEARRKQYEYYRNKLLSFEEVSCE